MKTSRSVIVLEFNELSPPLMRRFIDEGRLPNFRRFHDESQVYVSDAQEQAPFLNPWIQWVTVHSGLPYSEHRIFHLGDGHKLQQKCVWDLVSDAGMKSWVCGAMNIRCDKPLRGWVLPDPWSVGAEPFPDELVPYYKFVQTNVQEHTNRRVPLTKGDYLKFLGFMTTHGLSLTTVGAILGQLASEVSGTTRWKRAGILDRLQYDLFSWYYRRERPNLSVFFANSTAHLQHMHWREFEPERFTVKPSAEDVRRYKDAILFGYQQMDRLVGRFYDLLDDQTTLVLATALSQQPCLAYEEQGGKSFYRPHDLDQFVRLAGVTSRFTVSPVMSEQFHIFFENEDDARVAAARLESLRVGTRPVLAIERKDKGIFAGCSIFDALPRDATLIGAGSATPTPFFDVFYQVEGMKSGMHHPDGMLWIRQPDRVHKVHDGKVPLTEITPMLLRILGIPGPVRMLGRPQHAASAA